jgi:CDK-activating kinase assembly factor MAT1
VNTKETEALVAKYASENKEIIANNKRKQDEEAKWQSYTSEREKLDKRIKFENYIKELDEEKKRKEKEEAELIEELVGNPFD